MAEKDLLFKKATLVDVIERYSDYKPGDISEEIAMYIFKQLRSSKGLEIIKVWDAAEYIAKQLIDKYLIVNKKEYCRKAEGK